MCSQLCICRIIRPCPVPKKRLHTLEDFAACSKEPPGRASVAFAYRICRYAYQSDIFGATLRGVSVDLLNVFMLELRPDFDFVVKALSVCQFRAGSRALRRVSYQDRLVSKTCDSTHGFENDLDEVKNSRDMRHYE